MDEAMLPLIAAALMSPMHTFSISGEHFLLDGKPFVIHSGEMHYPRVPRPYWRDRFRKLRAMGLNTVCTYVFWNLHEPEQGKFDFSGNLDLAEYIKEAQEEGLWVIVRPGPYVCSEWDWGGFPYWLANIPGMKVRQNNAPFLKASDTYLKKVFEQIGNLQITKGGPVIMVQLENEYGSFGKDKDYLRAMQKSLKDAGVEVPLYTSDGPGDWMLAGGTLPDVASVVNFGGGAKGAFDEFAKFRTGVPRMCGEFWAGWFDHWGKTHSTGNGPREAEDLKWFLQNGVSFNIYMAHGGTSWGFMNGANHGGKYDSDTSSYDYGAAIDEAGRPSPKFPLFRAEIEKALPAGSKLPPLPKALPIGSLGPIRLAETAPLFDNLPKPVRSESPMTMEQLGQGYGFVLYRTVAPRTEKAELGFEALRDRAIVYVGGKRLGALERRKKESTLEIDVKQGDRIDILVENQGRVNFGGELVDEGRKGIVGKVTLGGSPLTGWEHYSFPFGNVEAFKFTSGTTGGPALHRGTFNVSKPMDTFLDMRGWGKGNVWMNGINLGRYWHIGPQQSLFLPGCWLKKGLNTIVVLEVEESTNRTVVGAPDPVFYTEPDYRPKPPTKEVVLDSAKLAAEGSFTAGDDWKAVSFAPRKARYVALEGLDSQNGAPFGGAAEIRIVDGEGNVMDYKGMTVAHVSSEEREAESGEAANVLDNQPTTIWHTEYAAGSAAYPHRIVIDLGSVKTVGGLRYLPRQGSSNGRIKKYRVFVSETMFPIKENK